MEKSAKMLSALTTRTLLSEHRITPNKALGQNFLVDETAVDIIIRAADITDKAVLEIGPGLGALTKKMIPQAKKVAAVELDRAMCAILQERFSDDLLLYNQDILHCDLNAICEALGEKSFIVMGNLPYYITTPICIRFLESGLPIESMTLMVQEEAASRFFAAPGERIYGPLSILSQLYYSVSRVLSLSPESYYPQPDVSSCVIRLSRNSRPFCEALPALLRACFQMRRKTLYNNLKAYCSDKEKIETALRACSLRADVRAESLAPESFQSLYEALL